MSSGYVIEKTDIAVDYWHVARKPFVQHFFLTHLHSDHIHGLSPSWPHKIYCSPTTAKLASTLTGVKKELFVGIELEQWTEIKDADGKAVFNVFLVDADHCPGAVMFLMLGHFGCILCTGDFRYDAKIRTKINIESLKEFPIDRVYLDSTYWNCPDVFPIRSLLKTQIVDFVAQRVKKDDVVLMAIPQVYIGREELLEEIAKRCRMSICVSPERLPLLRLLERCDVFTDRPDETNIRVVRLYKAKLEFRRLLNETGGKACLILPTSMADKLNFEVHENIKSFPYSDHCDRRELECFLKQLKIRSIVGVPCKISREEAQPFLTGTPPRFFNGDQEESSSFRLRSGRQRLMVVEGLEAKKLKRSLDFGMDVASASISFEKDVQMLEISQNVQEVASRRSGRRRQRILHSSPSVDVFPEMPPPTSDRQVLSSQPKKSTEIATSREEEAHPKDKRQILSSRTKSVEPPPPKDFRVCANLKEEYLKLSEREVEDMLAFLKGTSHVDTDDELVTFFKKCFDKWMKERSTRKAHV